MKILALPLLIVAMTFGFVAGAQQAPPKLQIQSPVQGQSLPKGKDIQFVAESLVPDGVCNEVRFFVDGSEVGRHYVCCPTCLCPPRAAGLPAKHDMTWSNAPVGVHKLVVEGILSGNRILLDGPVEFKVTDRTVPQGFTVAVTSPENGGRYPAGKDLKLVAKASDPASTMASLQFVIDGKPLGQAFSELCPPCFNPPCPLMPCRLPSPGEAVTFFAYWSNAPAGEHTISAVAQNTSGGSASSPVASFTVGDVATVPTVTIETVVPTAMEGDPTRMGVVQISRTGDTSNALLVFFTTSGQATPVSDYDLIVNPCPECDRPEIVLTEYRVTIGPGEKSLRLGLRAIDDKLAEGDETAVIELQESPILGGPGAKPPYQLGQPSSAKVTILDRGAPLPATLTFIQPRDGQSFVAPALIHIECAAVDPYGSIRHVEFYGDGKLIGQSDILTKDADVPGRPRTHFFDWANVPAGKHELVARAKDALMRDVKSLPVTVVVVEPGPVPTLPVVTIVASDATAYELASDDTLTFKVVRTGSLQGPLNVHFELDGTAEWSVDYVRVPELLVPAGSDAGTVTKPAPNAAGRSLWRGVVQLKAGESSAPLVFRPIPDKAIEGDETVVVRLVQPIPAPNVKLQQTYALGQPSEAKGVITEKPEGTKPVSIVITEPKELSEFLEPATVNVTAVAVDPQGYISRLVLLANGEKVGVSEIMFIRAPDPGTPITHHFTWKNVKTGKYALTARVERPDGQSTDSAPVHISVTSATPTQPVVRIETVDPEAAEDDAANIAVFRVVRTGATTGPLIVRFDTDGTARRGADYILIGESEFVPCAGCKRADVGIAGNFLTIPTGKESILVGLRALQDSKVEGVESVILRLKSTVLVDLPPSAFLGAVGKLPFAYQIGEPSEAKASIKDHAGNAPSITITRPATGSTFEAPADIRIEATAVDPNGYLPTLTFFANGARIGESKIVFIRPPDAGTPITHHILWEDAAAGTYEIIAVATDANGGKVTSPAVKITVQPAPEATVVSIQPGVPTTSEPYAVILPNPAAADANGKGSQGTFPALPAPATVTLARTGDLKKPLEVFYTVSGTASNGVDYVKLDGDAVIPAGQAKREIEVRALADRLLEGTESVVLTLVSNKHYKIYGKGSAEVHIQDADLPLVPTIVLRKPAHGAVFTAPANVGIEAVTFDPKGYIGFIELFANGQKIGEEGLAFPECVGCGPAPGAVLTIPFTWRNVAAGEYQVTARSKDSAGKPVESAPVKITVHSAPLASFVVRDLPDGYVAGQPFEVALKATPGAQVSAYAVEDAPPKGWLVGHVSDGGAYDPSTGKVKFGPFFDHNPRNLAYSVTPPAGSTERGEFAGTASADGGVVVIGGDRLIGTHVLHPADVSPENRSLSLGEVTAYASAWKTGRTWSRGPNPIPADYVTRAGVLWRGGEAYVFDPNAGPAPLCWINPPKPVVRLAGAGDDSGTGANDSEENPGGPNPKDGGRPPGTPAAPAGAAVAEVTIGVNTPVALVIRVMPAAAVTAWAVEEFVGKTAIVTAISDDGQFDAAQGVIRWGPFSDAGARKLSAEIAGVSVSEFRGIVSWDGRSRPVVHPPGLGFRTLPGGTVVPPAPTEDGTDGKRKGPRIAHVERRGDGVVQLVVIDDDAENHPDGNDLEVSDDLKTWRKVHEMEPGATTSTPVDSDADESEHRYYRVVRRP